MSNYGYRTASEVLPDLIAAIEEAGADLMEAVYSGGNDEGGVDDVLLYRRFEENGEEQRVQIAYAGGWSDPVWELANEMMSSKYYSWAGEFEASGTLYCDTREKHAWTDGSEMVWVDADVSDTIDARLS